ncbi:TPA: PP2C family serine/threonine-protein phosphatase [Yersinia enterocolitica]|nr:serine/threonine-protein phosphatase [Yersinia enterocolitica]
MFAERLAKWLSKPVANEGLNQPDNLDVVLRTDIGLKRRENQDRVVAMRVNTPFSSGRHFFVIALADGMGGMIDGAKCASLTLSTFLYSLIRYRALPPEERLKQSALDSNKAVYDFSRGNGGSTLSAIIIEADSQPCTLNIGDSRIYAYKKKMKGSLTRLTVDDSLEEVFGGDDRSLLQFVGMGEGIKPHTQYLNHEGDVYCLTSDGVHFIDEVVFDDILCHSGELTQAATRLGQYVRWCGAHDNASIALVDCDNIVESLNKNNDIGVEVWDAFSQLHILWMKNDANSAGYFEQNTLDKDSFNKEALTSNGDDKNNNQEKDIKKNNSYQEESLIKKRDAILSKNKHESDEVIQPELFKSEGADSKSKVAGDEKNNSKSVQKKTSYYKKYRKSAKKNEPDVDQASIKVVGDTDDEQN